MDGGGHLQKGPSLHLSSFTQPTQEGSTTVALEVSVNEIESAAIGGPGSEGMKALIEKMGKADRTFPAAPDQDELAKAFRAFMKRDEVEMFKVIDIGISARTFARSTKKLLDAIEIWRIRERIAARQQVTA
jgi:hypothetical protein